MMNRNAKRLLSLVLVLALCLGSVAGVHAAPGQTAGNVRLEQAENEGLLWKPKLTEADKPEQEVPASQAAPKPDEMVRAAIVLETKPTVQAGFGTKGVAENTAARNYREALRAEQDRMAQTISREVLGGRELDVVWNLTLTANLISANVPYGKLDAIAALPGVQRVVREMQFEMTEEERSDDVNMATSGSMIGSDVAYAAGLTGAGTRIAIIDTGLDLDHQAFNPKAYEYAIAEDKELYGSTYNQLTAEELAKVVPQLNLTNQFGLTGLTADDLYVNAKVPFGFNYIDLDDDITHDNDYQGGHGSHVAGIASANRYVMDRSGNVSDALETTGCKGVAPDAQLMIMKVFGKYGSPYESDYLAAIEDAILLGADSVNLSLGSGDPGFATTDPVLQEILDSLSTTDTVVTISASNSGSWSDFSGTGMTDARGYRLLYAEDVALDTVGSPGSYENALTVASVENAGTVEQYMLLGSKHILFNETLIGEDGEPYTNLPLRTLVPEGETEHTFEYIVIQGFGTDKDFAELGDALKGKIAVCSRGELNFFEKAENAVKYGAIATIVYNTEAGSLLMDLTDYTKSQPVVAISFQDGMEMVGAGTPVALPGDDHGYWQGEITIKANVEISVEEQAYYDISYFSSWGMPGDLSLKPEIAAPGGNIYSVDGETPGGTSYVTMSGTSMAAPQAAGMAALLAQYYRERQPNADLTNRQLAQSLLMSTAKPLITETGSYYSVLQQGAGLANVGSALQAESYIVMHEDATKSYADGKVKAELGDDPNRTGTYSFTFDLFNMTDEEQKVTLQADFFTQAWAEGYVDADRTARGGYMQKTTAMLDTVNVFTVDGKVLTSEGPMEVRDFNGDGLEDRADVQALLDYAVGNCDSISNAELSDLDGDGDADSHDAYLLLTGLDSISEAVLPADGSLEISVTAVLTDAQKADLEKKFSKGAYVEGYVYVKAGKTTHSVPVLAFYGNWSDPSMFERGDVWTQNLGMEDHAPYVPDNSWTNYVSAFSPNEGSYWYSGYNFSADPVNANRGAMNTEDSSFIRSIDFSAIRKSLNSRVRVVNTETGEVYFEREMGSQPSAFFYVNGRSWYDYANTLTLNWRGTDMNGNTVPNNTPCELQLTLASEYYVDPVTEETDWDALGEGATLSWPVYIDNERPVVSAASISGNKLTLTISDNYYVGGLMLASSDGEVVLGEYDLITYDQDQIGETHEVTVSLGDLPADVYTLQVVDYAMNYTSYRVFYNTDPTNRVDSVKVSPADMQLLNGHKAYVTASMEPYNVSDTSVTWSTSNPEVATVTEDGLVTAVHDGVCYITATSTLDPTKTDSARISVMSLDKTLNGAIMNYDGHTEWSEISVETLPEYTPMHEGDFMTQYSSAVKSPAGQIYACTQGYGLTGFSVSVFCKIDSKTYAPTGVSAISNDMAIFYADMTWAPHLAGGAIMAVWQDYLFLVDPDNGLYYAYQYPDGTLDGVGRNWHFCDDRDFEDMIGIAFAGSMYVEAYDTYMDYFYIMGSDGLLSLVGIMQVGDNWYFTENTRRESVVMDTTITAPYTMFYDSIYYDGDMLYWSYFVNNGGETRFYAITVDDLFREGKEPEIYDLGTLMPDIWPMTGLYEENLEFDLWNHELLGVDSAPALVEAAGSVEPIESKTQVRGIRGAAQNTNLPAAPAAETLVVPVTAVNAEKNAVETTNGVFEITWDPAKLTLTGCSPNTEFYSVKQDEGCLVFGYVNGTPVAEGASLVDLYFTQKADAVVTVTEKELNNDHDVTSYPIELALADVCPSAKFTDVNTSKWYHAAVDFAVSTGIMKGTSDTTFAPTATMTRAELAQLFYNMAGAPDVTGMENPFTDVKDSKWFAPAVIWAANAGIVNGTGDGKFTPGGVVTREQVISMLYRFAEGTAADEDCLASFDDASSVSKWAKESMNWAVANGYVQGSNNKLNPKGQMSRAEVAQLMMNYLQ